MGLLRADLQGLCNAALHKAGRRIALTTLIVLSLLAVLSTWVADALLEHPGLLPRFTGHSGEDALRALLGAGLMPCLVVAGWLGLALGQRQLFEAPELPLWCAAPVWRARPALQVLLRVAFLSLLWSLALALPFTLRLLGKAGAPPLAYALLPLAFALCTVPLLCSLLSLQVLLMRFLAGRILQLALAAMVTLASFGFSAFLLLGLFAPGAVQARLAAATAAPDRLPWTVATAAELLATASRGELHRTALFLATAWLVGSLGVFALAALLHPAAVERHLAARRPLLRWRSRRWPTSVAASLCRKELLQLLQQPTALLSMLVFALLVFGLAREQVLVRGVLTTHAVPIEWRHLVAMLAMWFLAVLLVLYAHMGRIALWDGPQWQLYQAAPAPPGAILRGKLQAIALLLLWPVLLVAAVGVKEFGCATSVLWVFLGTALAGNVLALGAVATVGTAPRLMRPDAGGQIGQGSRSFVAALALVVLFELLMAPAFVGWHWLVASRHSGVLSYRAAAELLPYVPALAWALALPVGGALLWLGRANYARLLQPR